jgi:hypothetical protein
MMNDEIYIGMYPPLSDEGLAMMAAITGHPHYKSDAPYIDSRLKAVHSRLEWEEGNIVGSRMNLYIRSGEKQTVTETLAVLLYHLDELYKFPPGLKDSVVEAGEFEFSELCRVFLGLDGEVNSIDYQLFDVPPVLACPNCGKLPPDLELQDMVYVCRECGWQANYQTEWPYLCYYAHPDWVSLGRLDIFVSRHLTTEEAENETV